jgi:hypothetical protein
MPDRNFLCPTIPDQADAMYTINTIHDQSSDLTRDINEERLTRAAGAGRLTQRVFWIVMILALSAAALLCVALILSRVLAH